MSMIREILVPVDGSEHAERAFEFAAQIAGQYEARLHLLHVVESTTKVPGGIQDFIKSEGLKDTPSVVYSQFVANQIIGSAEDAAGKKGVESIKAAVNSGEPAKEIIDYARRQHVDMIVLGTRGLGSVAKEVCRETERTCVLVRKKLLEDKRILIVDDEQDILETLEETLSICTVVTAASFEEGKQRLEEEYFDLAVLDIMGVDGYKLLEIANQKKIPAVMLTAHALSPEETLKSFKKGASYYIPKDKMGNIEIFLNDVLEAKARGKHAWSRWAERFGSYYDKKFGTRPGM